MIREEKRYLVYVTITDMRDESGDTKKTTMFEFDTLEEVHSLMKIAQNNWIKTQFENKQYLVVDRWCNV